MIKECIICGGNEFDFLEVLSKELINDWKLSANEVKYINFQQGFHCKNCKINLRSMTLSKQFMNHFSFEGTFNLFTENFDKKVLEINQAGGLSPYMKKIKNHILKEYPDIDIENINYSSESFDVIIHSDTLEHIPNTIRALQECKRVLKRGGVMFFTIPIIHNRLTMKRFGMPKSYHGDYEDMHDDLVVFTEYGSDFYMEIIQAGFKEIRLFSLNDESSFSIAVLKE